MLKEIKYIAYTSLEQVWVELCLEKKMLFDFVSMSPNCYERYSLAFIIIIPQFLDVAVFFVIQQIGKLCIVGSPSNAVVL